MKPTWADLKHLLACEAEFPSDMRWTLDDYIRGGYECRVLRGGAIWFGRTGDRLEIVSIAVLKASRCQGYARWLMLEAHSWGRTQGLKKAFLDVLADNIAAIALYRKLGYRVVGRTGGGALRMQVAL